MEVGREMRRYLVDLDMVVRMVEIEVMNERGSVQVLPRLEKRA